MFVLCMTVCTYDDDTSLSLIFPALLLRTSSVILCQCCYIIQMITYTVNQCNSWISNVEGRRISQLGGAGSHQVAR